MSNLNNNPDEGDYQVAYAERANTYSNEAKSFREDKYGRALRRASQWRLVAMIGITFGIAALGLLYYLFPLKQFVPVYYVVDPITKQAKALPLTKKPMVLEISDRDRSYWVNKFLNARESWGYMHKEKRQRLVRLMSSTRVWEHYSGEQISSSSSHENVIGNNGLRLIRLYAITHLNKRTANFRYEVRVVKGKTVKKEYWQGVIEYRWNPKHIIKGRDKLENPYGFTVTRYEISKEMIGNNK